MSDSDSDVPAARSSKVSDAKLVAALRDVVQRGGEDEQLTVNVVRAKVEKQFSLKPGFFKEPRWKERSARVIRGEEELEVEKASQSETETETSRGKKRKASSLDKATKSKKRRDDDDEESELSDLSDDTPSDKHVKSKTASKAKPHAIAAAAAAAPTTGSGESESPLSDDAESEELQSSEKPAPKGKAGEDDASESELSVLIDDDPPPKKRARKEPEPKTKKTKQKNADKKATTKRNEAEQTDPDKEEIKKLQGWLVKCGIRKLWGKELAPFESNKAKIRHLKEMLSDAGMTGRYSLEKARQIKESRELAADLEAVQEGNKIWGAEADEGKEDDGDGSSAPEGRPRRRLAKGLQELAFLSSEGESD